jgi:hypothetical protein
MPCYRHLREWIRSPHAGAHGAICAGPILDVKPRSAHAPRRGIRSVVYHIAQEISHKFASVVLCRCPCERIISTLHLTSCRSDDDFRHGLFGSE